MAGRGTGIFTDLQKLKAISDDHKARLDDHDVRIKANEVHLKVHDKNIADLAVAERALRRIEARQVGRMRPQRRRPKR